jgi:hypothetical protein
MKLEDVAEREDIEKELFRELRDWLLCVGLLLCGDVNELAGWGWDVTSRTRQSHIDTIPGCV